MTGPAAPAGWYPDPNASDGERYWTGSEWTVARARQAPPPPPPPMPMVSGFGAQTVTPNAPAKAKGWGERHPVLSLLIVLLVIAGVVGAITGGDDKKPAAGSKSTSTGATDDSQAAQQAIDDAAAAAPKPVPAVTAFRIGVKILEKTCFGSAGCNIIYRIVPTFVGPGEAEDLEVTYEVIGGEDGPQVNTFTVDDEGTASFDQEESLSTKPNPKLSARVVSVERAP